MELTQRLFAMEGVKTVPARNDFNVDREAMYTMVTGDRGADGNQRAIISRTWIL